MPKSTGKPTNLNKHFKVFTPQIYIVPTKEEVTQMKKQAKEDQLAKDAQDAEGKKKKKGEAADDEKEDEDPEPWLIKYNPKTSVSNITRWKIPAKRTVRLFIKYFSKVKT